MNTFRIDVKNVGMIIVKVSEVTLKNENPEKFQNAWEGAYKYQRITVIHEETKKQLSFDYYGAMRARMVENEQDAITAIYNYLSDAWIYYNDEFEDLGYNHYEDKETYNRVYNGCKKTYYRVTRWMHNINTRIELCDLLNQLQEDFDI